MKTQKCWFLCCSCVKNRTKHKEKKDNHNGTENAIKVTDTQGNFLLFSWGKSVQKIQSTVVVLR